MTDNADPTDFNTQVANAVTAAVAPIAKQLGDLAQANKDLAARVATVNAGAARPASPTSATPTGTAATPTPTPTPTAAPAKRLDEMTPAEQKAAALAALPKVA